MGYIPNCSWCVPFMVKWSNNTLFNSLIPNDSYSGCTAPRTSKLFILYIYSTNSGTEYFKHGVYCPFFPLQNAVCFIILTYLLPVLFTFYIQCALKWKKKNSGAKRLSMFTKLQEVSVSFVVFVCLSVHMQQLSSCWTGFHELCLFLKSIKKIEVSLKNNKNSG